MSTSDVLDSILSYNRHTDQEDDYYNIIGCSPLANVEQILAEYRIKAKLYHPDKQLQQESTPAETTTADTHSDISSHQNNRSEEACTDLRTEQFKRLVEAKEVLCDQELRRHYDSWRLSGLCMSFKVWKSLRATNHSMHWSGTAKTPPMLPHLSSYEKKTHLTTEELIRKFRNYEL